MILRLEQVGRLVEFSLYLLTINEVYFKTRKLPETVPTSLFSKGQ